MGVECVVRACQGRILGRKNLHKIRERLEEGRDQAGKDGVRMRSGEKKKKTKQKRRDRFTFNVQHKFEARTLIGAPRKTGRTDQIIRRDSCPP